MKVPPGGLAGLILIGSTIKLGKVPNERKRRLFNQRRGGPLVQLTFAY
jgi:hypothetical protein